MTREKIAAIAWLMLASLLIGASIGTAARAGAEPDRDILHYVADTATAVCDTLDDYPSQGGLTGIATAIMEDTGFSPYDTGRIIALAVTVECPRHIPLLQRITTTDRWDQI